MCSSSELTGLAVDLVLGNDDLAGVGVTGVLDGVAQDADDTDHLAHLLHAVFHVAGVADELLAARDLQPNTDSCLTLSVHVTPLEVLVPLAWEAAWPVKVPQLPSELQRTSTSFADKSMNSKFYANRRNNVLSDVQMPKFENWAEQGSNPGDHLTSEGCWD